MPDPMTLSGLPLAVPVKPSIPLTSVTRRGVVHEGLSDALGPSGVAGHQDCRSEVAWLGSDVRCGHGGTSREVVRSGVTFSVSQVA